MPDTNEKLTDRQRSVLDLHNAGKNPTEIGEAIGVTSQGVHGHLRRLRAKGLVDPVKGRRATTANGRPDVSLAGVLSNVQASIDAERAALDAHEQGIQRRVAEHHAEAERLKASLTDLDTARARLNELERQLTRKESS